jgi:ankyrin repeat protein
MDIWGAFSDGNEPGNSPNVLSLFNAASRNQLEKVNSILAKNGTLKIDEDVNGFNCFHIAAKKGHIEVIKRLHELYPDLVNTRTSDNQRSPLMLAAFEGNEIMAEYLSQFEV